MGDQIPLPFPAKGVVKTVSRSDQPDGTTWNASNILPFDRYDRPRGGQRPGTAKYWNIPLGSALQGLLQVTLATNPPPTISSTIFEDTFTTLADPNDEIPLETYDANYEGRYALAGTYFGAIAGTRTTVLPGGFTEFRWKQITTNDTSFGSFPGYVIFQSQPTFPANNTGLSVRRKVTYTPGTATFVVGCTMPSADAFEGAEANAATYVTWGLTTNAVGSSISASVENDGVGGVMNVVKLYQGSTAVASFTNPFTFAATTPVFDAEFTGPQLQMECNATTGTVNVYINGFLILTHTMTVPASGQLGFGYHVANTAEFSFTLNFQDLYIKETIPNPEIAIRQTFLIGVAGGNVWLQPQNGPQFNVGPAAVAASGLVSIASGQGKVFIADGSGVPKLLNLKTGVMETFTASVGSIPTNCKLVTVWRDRLVLAQQKGDEQNFFFSRLGDYTDWDSGATDPAAAVVGNASQAGHIGEPLTALMPFNDDMMILGGDHTLYMMRGDPADGGTVDLVSDAIGVYGQGAWAKDPTGIIYFAGPAGFYKMAPNQQPVWLSQTAFNIYFTQINRTTNYITLTWDRDRHGTWIFVTPADDVAQGSHLFYDSRIGGFWPQAFPVAQGPTTATVYDGDGPTDRVLLLGGFDGFIRKLSDSALDDDGTAITSLISLGPIQPVSPTGDSVVESLDVTLGEQASADSVTNIHCDWKIRAGKSAYEVTQGIERRLSGGSFTRPGRQLTRQQRLRGGWFAVELGNSTLDTYFSIERVVLTVGDNGRQR